MKKILTKNGKVITSDRKMLVYDLDGTTIKAGGGTLYKTNEYVEKLYFNTGLNVEEINNYLSTLEYADSMYNLFEDDIQAIIFADYSPLGLNGFAIAHNYLDGSNLTLIYCSNLFLAEQLGENFVGWNPIFKGFIELNSTSYEVSPSSDLPVNPSNITSDLVSTTPFTPNEEIELSGEYDGSTIEVTDLSGDWQGTLYKTNEYVEKLYFNTSLSVEEVDNYLSQLEYSDGMYNLFVDDIQVIGIMDASAMGINGYIIMSNYNDGSNLTLIYCSNSTLAQQMGENFEGWNTTFEGVLELNSTSYEVSPNNDLPVNPSNITSDLVSTTPFTKSEENTINIKKYINEKKIPLSIKVNVEGAGELLKGIIEKTIVEVNLSTINKIGSCLFYANSGLENVNLPNVTEIGDFAFYDCWNLKKINIPKILLIGEQAFSYCYSLKALVIRQVDSVCDLGMKVFENCYHISGTTDVSFNPTGAKDGYIYVPKALVEDYKSATNWSEYASQIRALEDYTIDGTLSGELDESKVNA